MMNIINIFFCDACCVEEKLPQVDKITFLYTYGMDSLIKLDGEMVPVNVFIQKIHDALGTKCKETRHRLVESYATDIPDVIMDGAKEVGKDNIIIDLTCGKKDITGSLYTTACISQVSNMIYVDVRQIDGKFPRLSKDDYDDMKGKFSLIRYESLDEIEKLASLNGMDFIFYKKDVDELRRKFANPKLESFCAQIGHIIEEYFSLNAENYRNAIRVMGLINEEITEAFGRTIYDQYKSILKAKNYNPKRSMDIVRQLEGLYQNKETPDEIKNQLEPIFSRLPAMFEMFEIFRLYRNRASHYREHIFLREEVKMLIDLMLLLLNSLVQSGMAETIWGEVSLE